MSSLGPKPTYVYLLEKTMPLFPSQPKFLSSLNSWIFHPKMLENFWNLYNISRVEKLHVSSVFFPLGRIVLCVYIVLALLFQFFHFILFIYFFVSFRLLSGRLVEVWMCLYAYNSYTYENTTTYLDTLFGRNNRTFSSTSTINANKKFIFDKRTKLVPN